MMRYFTLLLFIIITQGAQAQTKDTLNLMVYNLLNFPDGSNICGSTTTVPARWDTLQKIVNYAKPDVFMVCELQNEKGADSILNRSLNANGINYYEAANFVPNQSTLNQLHNMLYFNANKLGMSRQSLIKTDLRDVNKYTLFVKEPNLAVHEDTTFIDFYVTHLKAGESDSLRRLQECDSIRKYVDTNSVERNAVLAGDFNFYKSEESGYQRLLEGIHPFKDPKNAPGNWHNNFNFDTLHTQSSREFGSASMDCGATGGIDDRFDFLLMSEPMINNNLKVRYIPNTYKSLGNNGFLFNDAIRDPSNSSGVPNEVLNAMYNMSDHLPVLAQVEITYTDVSLPLEWTRIKGENSQQRNLITWEIAKNEDVRTWVIERSSKRSPFQSVAGLANKTTQKNWSFEDKDITGGIYYYRIKAKMQNGEFIYSSTIAIAVPIEKEWLQVFPNPAKDYLHIRFENLSPRKCTISIYNTLGEQVYSWQKSAFLAKNDIQIAIKDLAKGLYSLKIQNSEHQYIRKFIKN